MRRVVLLLWLPFSLAVFRRYYQFPSEAKQLQDVKQPDAIIDIFGIKVNKMSGASDVFSMFCDAYRGF